MEQMDNADLFDGDGKLTREEMKALDNFGSEKMDTKAKEHFAANRDALDKEMKAYFARGNVSDASKAHVMNLYTSAMEKAGEEVKLNESGENELLEGLSNLGETIWGGIKQGTDVVVDTVVDSTDAVVDTVVEDKDDMKEEGWTYNSMEIDGEKMTYRTKVNDKGSVDVYIDDGGSNTELKNIPQHLVSAALSFYKDSYESDMDMNLGSLSGWGNLMDNIGDSLLGDTMDYNDKKSDFRRFMDAKNG